jgi:hypothetical protein
LAAATPRAVRPSKSLALVVGSKLGTALLTLFRVAAFRPVRNRAKVSV